MMYYRRAEHYLAPNGYKTILSDRIRKLPAPTVSSAPCQLSQKNFGYSRYSKKYLYAV